MSKQQLYRIWNKSAREYWLAPGEGMTRSASKAHLYTREQCELETRGCSEDTLVFKPVREATVGGGDRNG